MKNTRTLGVLLSLTTMMTLASCGGDAKLEKAYITLATSGDHVISFTKTYDGQAPEIDLQGIKTNSDADLHVSWGQKVEKEDGSSEEVALNEAPINAGVYILYFSVEKTSKFEARTIKKDYEITKATFPASEFEITFAEDFPTEIHFTQSGSGRNVVRTAVAAEVTALKSKVTVKKGTATWKLGDDYDIAVAVSSATAANVQIVTQNYNNANIKAMTAVQQTA